MQIKNIVLVVVLGILAAFFLIFWEHEFAIGDWRQIFSEFRHELGMGMLVAALLAGSIEYLNARRHERTIRDIQRNVLNAVLERELPKSIYQQLNDSILTFPFYRKDYETIYTLKRSTCPVSGEPLALLQGHQKFKVVNMTEKKADYPCRLQIGINRLSPTLCKLKSLKINGRSVNPKKISAANKKNGGPFLEMVEKVRLAPGAHVEIDCEYDQCGTLTSFESFCSIVPAIDMKLRIFTPQQDFVVECETMHPDDAVPDEGHDGTFVHTWKLPGASLPGQGMQFKWHPRAASTSNNPQAATHPPSH